MIDEIEIEAGIDPEKKEFSVRGKEIEAVSRLLAEKPVVVVEGIIGSGKSSFLREAYRRFQEEGKNSYFFDCNSYLRISMDHSLLDFEDFLDEADQGQTPVNAPTLFLDNADTLYGNRELIPSFQAPEFMRRMQNLIDEGKIKLITAVHKREKTEEYPGNQDRYNLFQETIGSRASSFELSARLGESETLDYLNGLGVRNPTLQESIREATGSLWADLKILRSFLNSGELIKLSSMTAEEQKNYIQKEIGKRQWWKKYFKNN